MYNNNVNIDQDMAKVFSILETTRNTASKNEKQDILKQHKDNDRLKLTLHYGLNPFKVYGIGDKAFKDTVTQGEPEHSDIFDLLDYLLANNTGSDTVKDQVNLFIQHRPAEHRDWYKRIILKDLNIGMSEKSVNKVFTGLIPVFDVMLASPMTDKTKLPKEIIIEPKLDGIRCVYVNGKLFSRNGKELEGFTEITDQLAILSDVYSNNPVFDGELMGDNFTATQELTFRKQANKTNVNYHIFDSMNYDEFMIGKSKNTLSDRYHQTKMYGLASINNKLSNLKFVNYYYKGNSSIVDLTAIRQVAIDEGYEGIMIKDLDSKYEAKRSKAWLKFKLFETHDLEVIDVFEGSGKYLFMLGGVVCKYKDSTVEVGSGFTDEERSRFWENLDTIFGHIIEVQAQEESHNKDGKVSLRFPTFKGIRYDKSNI